MYYQELIIIIMNYWYYILWFSCCMMWLFLFLFSGVTSFALLQRMLNFVQGLQYYMSYEVLEPNYRHLENKLSRVVTIDEVLALHTGQLNTLSLPFICTCSLFLSFLSSVYLNIIFSFFLLSFQIFWIVVWKTVYSLIVKWLSSMIAYFSAVSRLETSCRCVYPPSPSLPLSLLLLLL